jgi:hypothetical protein
MQTEDYRQLRDMKHANRENVSYFERRRMHTEKISTTLEEEVCGQTKYRQFNVYLRPRSTMCGKCILT